MSKIGASGIREVFDRARALTDPIDLSLGLGWFDVPAPIREGAARAAHDGNGRYGPTEGHPALRAAAKRYLCDRHGLSADEDVLITTGTTGAIVTTMFALVDPGTEVLLPDPYFVLYEGVVRLCGAEPVLYRLTHEFRIDPEAIEQAITDRTALVVLNNPANPTGVAYSADEVRAVAEVCARHDVPLLSDELYELFTLDHPHTSVKHFMGAGAILVGGPSKAFGMAGWRVGWAAGAPEVIGKMRVLQQFLYSCAPTISQQGALAGIGLDPAEHVDAYRAKRDRVYRRLTTAGYDMVKPTGAFFAFPRVPWGDDVSFCNAGLERSLIVVPGRAFGTRTDHFRICIAAPDELLDRGLDVLVELARQP
jgi:aspartate aminotransferase/aminotransferase